ncbi:MAG: Uma2 family endonuclease [Dehalococcoidia bacterium]|nr:Uma2 family endonuclease [Dehalococcoidia bacterium]
MVTTPKLTYQDYANLEGDERYELLNGELILVASPNRGHQSASVRLLTRMHSFVEENDLGWVYCAPFDVLFTDTDVVQPDILFISREREHILTPANVQGAPDLIVEILSPSSSTRDWRSKRELYSAHGVREYWIVDPTNRIVSILLPQDGVLEIDQTHTEDETATSTVIEGFSVSLDTIFS